MPDPAGNPTRAVREGEQLDWKRLDAHLRSVLPGLAGVPRVTQYRGGASNLTYLLRYDNDDLVVRRPPFGTKARTAHSMSREYQIISRLRPVYPAVPEALHYSDDERIIGSEFYVMRKVPGDIAKLSLPAHWHFEPADTRRFCINFWDKLIELHGVDIAAAGLGDFGKPHGYAERQVTGWNNRYERALTPDVDSFTDVRGWLAKNIPPEPGRHAVLHGDYRIDNVIVAADDPFSIRAVLDWEICALGDPLMDLGNALAYWIEADDPPQLKGLMQQPSTAPGMLSRAEIRALYSERTGLDTTNFTFYQVYGYWRTAVIVQQIYYRFYHGQTADPRFSGFGVVAQHLGGHCQNLIAAARTGS